MLRPPRACFISSWLKFTGGVEDHLSPGAVAIHTHFTHNSHQFQALQAFDEMVVTFPPTNAAADAAQPASYTDRVFYCAHAPEHCLPLGYGAIALSHSPAVTRSAVFARFLVDARLPPFMLLEDPLLTTAAPWLGLRFHELRVACGSAPEASGLHGAGTVTLSCHSTLFPDAPSVTVHNFYAAGYEFMPSALPTLRPLLQNMTVLSKSRLVLLLKGKTASSGANMKSQVWSA